MRSGHSQEALRELCAPDPSETSVGNDQLRRLRGARFNCFSHLLSTLLAVLEILCNVFVVYNASIQKLYMLLELSNIGCNV